MTGVCLFTVCGWWIETSRDQAWAGIKDYLLILLVGVIVLHLVQSPSVTMETLKTLKHLYNALNDLLTTRIFDYSLKYPAPAKLKYLIISSLFGNNQLKGISPAAGSRTGFQEHAQP